MKEREEEERKVRKKEGREGGKNVIRLEKVRDLKFIPKALGTPR
jgi:hypothetical protein